MSLKKLALVSPVVLALACSPTKKFGGGVQAAKVPEAKTTANAETTADQVAKTDTSTASTDTATTTPDTTTTTVAANVPACDASQASITQVKLLSSGINFSLANQTLRYELSVVSCKDGSIIPIKDQNVSFDLNATSLNGFPNIAYSVLNAADSKSIASGKLNSIIGSDLFGHTGDYAHWETDALNYATALDKVILEIELDNVQLTITDKKATTVDSYLKVGNAAAVTQALTLLK